ncbi:MAG: hypothetical protein R3B53_04380 [Candidatus Paceibacterota bacterium]
MPRQNSHTLHFLNAHHHFAKYLAPGTLGAFRLLKLREDFKIFSRRKLTQLKELCFDRHDLFVIVFGAFASVEKIFWFGHTILDSKETKLLKTHLA